MSVGGALRRYLGRVGAEPGVTGALLWHGASADHVGDEGVTPLDLALWHAPHCVPYLQVS